MTRVFIIFACLLTLGACSPSKKIAANQWQPLFNGKNLNGWQMKISGQLLGINYLNTFRVENGILKIRYDQYESFDNQFGALHTTRPYTNYRLKVEYRFVGELTKGAPSWGLRDSGVQFHGQNPTTIGLKQSFPVCLEYNLHGGNGKEERPVGEICLSGTLVDINGAASKGCNPPMVKRTIHGDEWATLEIDVKGDTIRQFINGEEIIHYENPRYDPNNELAKAFIKNGDTPLHSGFISLQSNSHPIDFRKIEILEYKD